MHLVIDEACSPEDAAFARRAHAALDAPDARIYGMIAFVALEAGADVGAALAAVSLCAELDGEPSLEVSRDEARAILEGLIERDLAHNGRRGLDVEARITSEQFVARFGSDAARFFTNGSLALRHAKREPGGSWSALTHATFDSGVAAVDVGKVGILWIEDED